MLKNGSYQALAGLCAILLSSSVLSSDKAFSPPVNSNHPVNVYWGDTHLHTSNSLDARVMGLTLGVEEAYQFARGDQVTMTHGQPARLHRPLDFLVVADHSDALGIFDQLLKGNPDLLRNDELRQMHNNLLAGQGHDEVRALLRKVFDGEYSGPFTDPTVMRSVWERYVETADQFNQPGRFTAMIGYEWTPMKLRDSGDKLHRNILYRDGASVARRMMPFTAADSMDPQNLWKWMQRYEENTGGKVLALAHNGNLSNGQMFPVETNPNTGAALDAEYIKARARWEPLYEVTQIKGDSESHPTLSPADEFADFETVDLGNGPLLALKTPDMLKYEYAREALKNGLKLERELGSNPYQFGMVGSTDSHTALSSADENNFSGVLASNEPSAERIFAKLGGTPNGPAWNIWEFGAAGYAAVWAKENTRESIWDAMQRREVYASTGPRITLRFFGGWSFTDKDTDRPNLAHTGYDKGVPMGAMLPTRKGKQSPSFLISALKDPDGAHLDRVQIIKGWLDEKGRTQEKVYDVAWSGQRQANANGKIPAVGTTVDVEQASYTNSIGSAQLTAVWQDPNFNASESAFYYVRVIEIPTPRWPAFDAKFFDIDLPEEVPVVIQERAYSSPIWFQP